MQGESQICEIFRKIQALWIYFGGSSIFTRSIYQIGGRR